MPLAELAHVEPHHPVRSPNSDSASALASSVLPTPVGPRNRKLPTGRSGSPSPARVRRTASATAATASSWPITRSCRCSSRRSSRSRSSSVSWRPGCRWRARRPRRSPAGPPRAPARTPPSRRSPGDLLLQLGDLVAQRARPPRSAPRRPPASLSRPSVVELRSSSRRSTPGVRAQAQPGAGLVDQVDRLVRQEPVGDVAVGQLGRGVQRLVGEAHPVVLLVPVAQAAQDRTVSSTVGSPTVTGWNRRASAASFSILAVLLQRGRADQPQLAAGQGGLEHVAGVHAALAGAAGADHGVQLVEEDDQLVPVRPDLVDQLLQPLLEVAAVAGARDQAGQVELDDALAAQGLRHVAVDDALGQALDDRGLADAGLADQHRVVLGAPGQDLDGLLDLVGAADHRVDLAVAGQLGEVLAVLVERGGAAVRLRRRSSAPRSAGRLQRLGWIRPRRAAAGRRLGVERSAIRSARGRRSWRPSPGRAGGRRAARAWRPGSATGRGSWPPGARSPRRPARRAGPPGRRRRGVPGRAAARAAARAQSRWSVSRSLPAGAAARRAASESISRASALMSRVMSTRWAVGAGSARPKKRARNSSHGSEPRSPGPIMSVLRSRARHGRQGLPGARPDTPHVAAHTASVESHPTSADRWVAG